MYNAAWPGSGDSRFMKDVLVVLSQKPLTFTAKGCMLVQMEMFSKVIETIISHNCISKRDIEIILFIGIYSYICSYIQ